ncbi:MAG TPA: hypothetical protein ENG78_02420 [Acidiferrobacteraceae bacterium]|nr:hypothetical protein [Acidiferrobacteraceae bacterium]HEX19663.1 hypothetical protein [Acidiferrobacteraceae bacterium]
MDKVISVTTINFPDGTTIWFESDEEYMGKCVKAWNDNLVHLDRLKYEEAGITMVAGQLKMFESDYFNVATKNFPWPDQ